MKVGEIDYVIDFEEGSFDWECDYCSEEVRYEVMYGEHDTPKSRVVYLCETHKDDMEETE